MKIVATHTTLPTTPLSSTAFTFVENRLTNPARTEVEDGLGNWLATLTDGSRTVLTKGPTRTFREIAMPIQDEYNRTRATSWGALTQNGSWSLTGTSVADFSVGSGVGTIAVTTAGSSARATVFTHSIQDADVKALVSTNKQAIGDNITAALLTGYQDTDNHYMARVELTVSESVISDSFTRTVSSAWGTASSGQAWSTSGTASDYSTNGSRGQHSLGSLNVSRRSFIGSGTDFDARVKVSTSALAAGSSLNAGIVGRYIDSNNHYIFRIRFSTTQGIFAAIQKQISGTVTTLGSEVAVAGLTHGIGTFYWVRAQAVGSTLQIRIWEDGQSEPGTWNVSLVDTSLTGAGAAGTRSLANTGVTTPLPIMMSYDDFSCTFDNGGPGDPVQIRLYKQVAGVLTSLSSTVDTGLYYSVTNSDKLWIRMTMSGGTLQAKTWKNGTSEPGAWQVTGSDATFTTGRVGIRAFVNSGSTVIPVTYAWEHFSCAGNWTDPPTVTHDKWVRIAPTPFNGTLDTAWLTTQLQNVQPDVLEVATQYIYNALPIVHSGNGLTIANNCSYGPLETDGSRQEGSDFNDFLGIPWTYTGVDNPEGTQFQCLDCSGYVRMVFGYRLGMVLSLTALDGVRIPRVSSDIVNSGPGVVVVPNTGVPPSPTDYSKIQPGDIIGFDADTSNPDEEEGQIDHVGIYLGQSTDGRLRFFSSRKTPNGPTFGDVGGYSYFDTGTALYARSIRSVRRF